MGMKTKKIKVLHRAATTGIGGVEQNVMNYYRHMDRERFQFDFLTRNAKLAEYKEVKELGINVKTFTATERSDKNLLIKEINQILDEGYDIIHMNTSYWVGFLIEELAMERHIPKVIVHSHSAGIDLGQGRERALEIHEYYKEKFDMRYATDCWACSRLAADWLFGPQIPRNDIRIIKNAIDIQKYSFNQNFRLQERNKLGLDNCFVIGHIGRFAYQKNHEFLIKVFAGIFKKNDKARLVLIGEGGGMSAIKAMVQEMELEEAVNFLGWQDNVNELLSAIDLFVLPSRLEGLPVVLVEAQASGVRCIISDCITDEVCITDNVDRLPLDEDEWIQKIGTYMEGYDRADMREKITAAGYDIAEQAAVLEKYYEDKNNLTGGAYKPNLINYTAYEIEVYAA